MDNVNGDSSYHSEQTVEKENPIERIEENRKEGMEENRIEGMEENRIEAMEENRKEAMEENRKEGMKENRKEAMEENRKEAMEENRKEAMEENRKEAMEENRVEGMEENGVERMEEIRIEGMEENRVERMEEIRIEGMDENGVERMEENRIEGMEENGVEGMEEIRIEGMEENRVEGMEENRGEGMEENRVEGMEKNRVEVMEENRVEEMEENRVEELEENRIEEMEENRIEEMEENRIEEMEENRIEEMEESRIEEMEENRIQRMEEILMKQMEENLKKRLEENNLDDGDSTASSHTSEEILEEQQLEGQKENDIDCPTPLDIERITSSSLARLPVDYVKNVMKGPICWKCYTWVTFFKCQNCERSFHRECAFMGPGFPHPIFDKSAEDAMKANWGEVNLLKCPVCITSEETRVTVMKGVEVDLLNRNFCRIASVIASNEKTTEGKSWIAKIQEKASQNGYKTVEGFYAEFKKAVYDAITNFGNHETIAEVDDKKATAKDVAEHLELAMKYCWECDTRRYNVQGKYLPQKHYSPINRLTCQTPHAVLWVKELGYPFWPTKILGFEGNYIHVQCFGEAANPRSFLFPNEKVKFKVYSKQRPKEAKLPNKAWGIAVSDCNAYLEAMKAKFGEEGVVVPEKSDEFDGNVEAIIKKMYPLHDGN